MRVLVTGGLGFTGQAVARNLLEHDHQVVVLSSSEHPRSLVDANVVRADLRDRDTIAEVMAAGDFEGVCHLAALTRVRDSFADPVGYFDVNVGGTVNLLRALDSSAGPPVRFVLASTSAVYGIRDGVLTEDDVALPANPYGASKLAAEQLLGYQATAGHLAAVTLRCFNIAGAVAGIGDDDLTRIIPKTLAVAAGTAEQLEINGDGSAVREYTHVLDIAEAFRLALEAAAPGKHQIYNVGSEQGTTLTDVVDAARRITGQPVPTEHRPPKPEARVLMSNSAHIREELGWNPAHSSIDEILRDGWAAITHP